MIKVNSLETYNKAKEKIEKLRQEAAALEKVADEFRVNSVRTVPYKQTSRYVFEVNHPDGRKLKYYSMVEGCPVYHGKKKIASIPGGVHAVRFMISQGKI